MLSRCKKIVLLTQPFVLIAVLLTACGLKGTTTVGCTTGTAQITVTDNSIIRNCGCTEASGVSFIGQNFVCTVPVGTRLYVYYSIQNEHHLQFGNPFALLNDYQGDGTTQGPDGLIFTQTGTDTFSDIGTGGLLGGSFIVQ